MELYVSLSFMLAPLTCYTPSHTQSAIRLRLQGAGSLISIYPLVDINLLVCFFFWFIPSIIDSILYASVSLFSYLTDLDFMFSSFMSL